MATMYANKIATIDFSDLKQRIKTIDIAEFLSLQGFQIRRNVMCCPFCGSGTGTHKTPAFHIFPDNHYRCFSCQRHGDVIDFTMQVHGLEYPAAIEFIAKEMGIPIPELQPGGQPAIRIKIQVGTRLIFDQGKNSIIEVPKYRFFRDREAGEIFVKKRELEMAEKLCIALASIAMVLAEHDEDIDLIVEVMGTDFEKRYFSLMKDKRFAFGKIIEWQNKN